MNPPPAASPSRPKVLLIGWDSADWQVAAPLMAKGEMPHLRRLVERGAHAPLATLEPMLSPMLWTSIATGKRAYDHGICGFTDVSPEGKVRPVGAASRRCRAIWDILAENGVRSHVISWFATHGEQIPGGSVVSNLFQAPTAPPGQPWPPAPRGTIWPEDPETLAALNDLRLSPEEVDESIVRLFVPGAIEVDQEKDHRLGHLRVHLAEAFSVHAATCWTLQNRGWDFVAVYYRAIDELCHHFMPFHPPRLDGVPEELYSLYHDVVNSAYRLHDLFLGRLLALAGPDAHVILCSDHGFYSDHQRPKFVPKVPAGITVWHRRYGILAAAGPRIAPGAEVFGASLLDLTPTLLHLYGLPVGEDMEGKVLATLFREPPVIQSIPTWENPDRPAAPNTLLTDAESQALLETFAALGYLDRQAAAEGDQAVRATLRENTWSLARALFDGGKTERALPLLEDLVHAHPERADFARALARCQAALGLHPEARATLEAIVPTLGSGPARRLFEARLALHEGRERDALPLLDALAETHRADAEFWFLLSQANLNLRRWPQTQAAARQAIALKADHALAHLHLAISRLHQDDPAAAETAALRCLELEFATPHAHFILGLAQIALGHPDRAEAALQNAIRFAPGFARAHQWLARLYRRQTRFPELAGAQAMAELAFEARRAEAAALETRRAAAATRLRARPPRQAPAAASADNLPAAPTSEPMPPPAPAAPPITCVIVSGLPRSGTSLMMQMLAAGGLPLLTDGLRAPDDSNQEGYHEWEPVKQLPRAPGLIAQAAGRALKVVTPLLGALPRGPRYKIILMRRPLAEIARSQHRMRFGTDAEEAEVAHKIVPVLAKHVAATVELLRHAPDTDVLEVDYPSLVAAPAPVIERLAAFLGARLLPAPAAMAACVRPGLHRQREK
jgi:predicted AlkP superfamily phosphohydrolase/phosphomutase/predicted Zn-dependent protease